jgi:hypothetical protein
MNKKKINFWLDVTLFVLFVTTTFTGLITYGVSVEGGQGPNRDMWVTLGDSISTVHTANALALILGSVIHIGLHWGWIKNAAKRFFRKEGKQIRGSAILNSLLFGSFLLSVITGLAGTNSVHIPSSLTMAVILLIHLLGHMKWIAASIKYHVLSVESPKKAARRSTVI